MIEIPPVGEGYRPLLEDNGGYVRFLTGMMDKTAAMIRHADSQTNILIGISSALFAISLSAIRGGAHATPLYVLGTFSALSAVISLYAVHPPKFMRSKGQAQSMMYHKNVASLPSSERYAQELVKIMASREQVVQEFATEIFNLSKYYYLPKRRMFNTARNVLLVGIFLSLIALLVLPVL